MKKLQAVWNALTHRTERASWKRITFAVGILAVGTVLAWFGHLTADWVALVGVVAVPYLLGQSYSDRQDSA